MLFKYANCWDKKRTKKAYKHTKKVAKKYKKEIAYSIKNTFLYSNKSKFNNLRLKRNMEISITEIDSVSAILQYGRDYNAGNVAILNFADYKNPGGGFIRGSIAQEECLCHESFLYNVLKEFPKYYEHNIKNMNKSLYTNRALYSKDVIFERDNIFCKCDVITCAAPNYKSAFDMYNISNEKNTKFLRRRIKFVLDIAEHNKVDTLILGAYGAGVFGQSAEEVAQVFKEYLSENKYCFRKIIFAIIPGENVEPFKKVFE